MKKGAIILLVVVVLLISIVAFIGYRAGRSNRVVAQGFVEATTLRLASKIAGRIDKVFVDTTGNLQIGRAHV